jgi:tRNA modification GTPase
MSGEKFSSPSAATGDTIFALSSGAGRAAIAIIRISGPSVRIVLETMAGGIPTPRHAALRRLRDQGSGLVLDEGLVLFFPGPRSETGEDLAEFQVHGSRAVVSAILTVLSATPGLRLAEPGEFARRALANGKMDLLDVEALADLIDSDTEAQRRQAIEGAGSLLRGKAEGWRTMLLDILADLEAGIDFSDEGDVQDHFKSGSERLIRELIVEMDHALAIASRGERLREGFRVALLGPPNAGKSSLLNALAGRDVAIVSDVPGTTRDRLDVSLDLAGIPVVVSDTAGLQATADAVEREGIRRAQQAAKEADLMLWLSPVDRPVSYPTDICRLDGEVWTVSTKVDLCDRGNPGLSVSAWTGQGIDHLLTRVGDRAREALGGEPALITRSRQKAAIIESRRALVGALSIDVVSDPELCVEEVRMAVRWLERLVGRVDIEDVLGSIFSRFCIGK